jgi:hypothetical protein
MVLWQHASLELERLLHHVQSILVTSKGRVRVGKIAHCVACSRQRHSTRRSNTYKSRSTNVRVVLRQHAPIKLKRLLPHRQRIFVPPELRVRDGETVHCDAYSRRRYCTRSITQLQITLNLNLDHSLAARAA